MPTTDLGPTQTTALQALDVVADGLERIRDHIQSALQLAERLQHDYHGDPAERAAVASLTETGHLARLWRGFLGELEYASDKVKGTQFDLDVLEDKLDSDQSANPDNTLDNSDSDTPELRPAAVIIPFPGA
jgi:hypothetical protein